MQTPDANRKLYDEAVSAWEKCCLEKGAVFQQPNRYLSEIGTKYVYLRNINGLLAKYDIQAKKIITE